MSTQGPRELYEKHALSSDSKEIRVLDILPASGPNPSPTVRVNSPIEARIRVVNLDSNPRFTALSYVCGIDAGEPPTILCDDVPIKVYCNCYSALWHLRRRLGQLTIWVDCISINATDPDEKSRQIPLMGDIYSQAAVVYAWLGRGSISSQRAMSYLSTAGFQRYIRTLPNGMTTTEDFAAGLSLYISRLHPTYHPVPFAARRMYLSSFQESQTS